MWMIPLLRNPWGDGSHSRPLNFDSYNNTTMTHADTVSPDTTELPVAQAVPRVLWVRPRFSPLQLSTTGTFRGAPSPERAARRIGSATPSQALDVLHGGRSAATPAVRLRAKTCRYRGPKESSHRQMTSEARHAVRGRATEVIRRIAERPVSTSQASSKQLEQHSHTAPGRTRPGNTLPTYMAATILNNPHSNEVYINP